MNRENPAESKTIFDEAEIKQFIKIRCVVPEDFYIIEELSRVPSDLIIEKLHNIFNMYQERSTKELELLVTNEKNAKIKRIYELALAFGKKYNWAAGWNLIRIIEERRIPFTLRDLEELQ